VLQRFWFPLLLLHAFLVQALTILLRVGAVYQAVAIDLGVLWIGIIGGAFGILPSIFGLHLGRYIDRYGETTALVWGSVAMLLSSLCLTLLAPALATLLAGSIIMGAGQFLCIAAQQSAASKAGGPSRAQNIGRLTLAIAVAQAAGPLGVSAFSGGALLPDTDAIFLASAIMCAVCVLCALLMRLPRHHPSVEAQGILQIAKTLIGTSGFQLATYASLVIFSAMDLLVVYLPLYGAEHGIAAGTVGVLLAVRAAASIVSRFFFSWVLGRVGRNRLLLLSLCVSGVAIGLLALTAQPLVMGVLLFLAGLGLGVGAPLTLAWLADIVPANMRGSAFSLRLAFNRVGQTAIPIAAGFIVGPLGLTGVLLAVAASLLLSAGVSARKLARHS
jgi:MFS family permease